MKVEQDGGILRCHSRKEESCSLEQNDLEVSVQLRGRASGEHPGAQLCPQSSQFKALPSASSSGCLQRVFFPTPKGSKRKQ